MLRLFFGIDFGRRRMGAVAARWMIAVVFLATFAKAPAHAQSSGVQKFQIRVPDPAYTGLPIWIYAELSSPLEIRYPYGEDPDDFGPSRLEVRRGNDVLAPVAFKPWVVGGGIVDGSIAPATSPTNRLPLHLEYSLNTAGVYSVRWTVVRHLFRDGQIAETVVAQSDWLDFEVKQSSEEQRSDWLQKEISKIPNDAGKIVGDYFPSLLADAPNPHVLQVILRQIYSTDRLIHGCALGSLRFFREEDIRTQVVEMLHLRGPNDSLAYVISWHAPWFQDRKDELVRTILPYLHSREDWQVAATLKMLGFLVHLGNFQWPAGSEIPAKSDQAVLAAAPELIGRSPEVAQLLAEYLGGIRSNSARELLWQVAERPEPAHEQALIALTWIGDQQDLPRLAELLVKPGDADKYGRDLASLPYQLLVRAYGDRAVTYLERAVSESPYAFVRTQSAEELALRGRPIAYRFFLDALENNRFYKQELIGWLKTRFPNEIPASQDDAGVIAFLKSRLQP